MKNHSIFIILILLLINLSVSGQGHTDKCRLRIVRLVEDKSWENIRVSINDSLLRLCKLTDSVLVDDSALKRFEVKTDTICCNYGGLFYKTSHHYFLDQNAVTRISGLRIPLCCGIPVAVLIDDKEIYRAMLWNPVSSFGNNCITMTLLRDELVVINRLPDLQYADGDILSASTSLLNCLQNRK